MKSTRFLLAIVGLGAVSSAACYPKTIAEPPVLTSAQVTTAASRSPATTPELLERGRAAFTAKCNSCHGYPDLAAVPEAKWPKLMADMGKKASMTPEEWNDALRFVLAAGAR